MAEYLEAIPDCQLIPNQTYQMTGDPITVIQPKVQLRPASIPAPTSHHQLLLKNLFVVLLSDLKV